MLLAIFLGIPVASTSGPATGNMLIRIYSDPTQEENALAAGDIDISDWPLTSTFINNYATDPAITMNQYAGIDMFQFDINNQLWPTGPITSPRSGPKNDFFNPAGIRDIAALHFRRALAHLTNKDKYVTSYLGGYGYVLGTIVPVPALEGYTDYSTLTNATAVADAGPGGYMYPYDRAAAISEFELGGFRDWDGDTKREWSGDGGSTYEELPNMKFWIRLDDPNRRQAGEDLYNEMVTVGIPEAAVAGGAGLDTRISERSTCFNNVMVLYDYNIYTGNWGDDFFIDPWLDDWVSLYDSTEGQWRWATNYPGFKNSEYDSYALRVNNAVYWEDIRPPGVDAQYTLAKYVGVIPLWSVKGVKGYRSGWSDTVNHIGAGTDNYFSFLGMNWVDGIGNSRNGPANTVVCGFKSDVNTLNPIMARSRWETAVRDLIYDSFYGSDPYSFGSNPFKKLAAALPRFYLEPYGGGLRVNVYIPLASPSTKTGQLATVEFVRDALNFLVALVQKIPWWVPTPKWASAIRDIIGLIKKIATKVTDPGDPNLQTNEIKIAFDFNLKELLDGWKQGKITDQIFGETPWGKKIMRLLGFGLCGLPVLNYDLWMSANQTFGWNYKNGTSPPETATFGVDPMTVLDYNPSIMDANFNGIVDLREDGTGPWTFGSYAPGNYISLTANPYHTTADVINSFVNTNFHRIGNVNYPGGYGEYMGWYTADKKIDLADLILIATSAPSSSSDPWGKDMNQYNPDADIDSNGRVDVIDLITAGTNYYKKQG